MTAVEMVELVPDTDFPKLMDRRFRVVLDCRPMGSIFHLNKEINKGWTASSVSGCPLVAGVTKDEAVEALL